MYISVLIAMITLFVWSLGSSGPFIRFLTTHGNEDVIHWYVETMNRSRGAAPMFGVTMPIRPHVEGYADYGELVYEEIELRSARELCVDEHQADPKLAAFLETGPKLHRLIRFLKRKKWYRKGVRLTIVNGVVVSGKLSKAWMSRAIVGLDHCAKGYDSP